MSNETIGQIIETHGGLNDFVCFVYTVTDDGVADWFENCITNISHEDSVIDLTAYHEKLGGYFTSMMNFECFMKRVEDGTIVIKEGQDHRIDRISWVEPISGAACIHHEANVVVNGDEEI